MRTRLLLLSMLLAASPGWAADELTDFERCLQHTDKQIDAEMDECTIASIKDFDAKLNARYVYLLRASGDRFKGAFKAAQRAWIAYRDTTCDFEGGTFRENIGTLDRSSKLSCVRNLTEERVKWLGQQSAE